MPKTITLMPNGSDWLTMDETMRALGRAKRTVQELAKTGELRFKSVSREGTKPQRLYSAVDVAKLIEEPKPKQTALALERPKRETGQQTQFMELLTLLRPSTPAPVKLWLSIEEAAEYSGLAHADLLRLVQGGHITARKSGGWKIQRASLEAFAGE